MTTNDPRGGKNQRGASVSVSGPVRPELLPQIVSRQEAIALDQKWYFTGKPCIHGHVAKRSAATTMCYRCKHLDKKKRERNKTEQKRTYFANTFKKCAKCEQDKPLAEFRLVRKRNPDWCSDCREKYRHKNPNKKPRTDGTARKKARELLKANRVPQWSDRKLISAVYRYARALRDAGFDCHVDHIVPLRGFQVSGYHCPENLQVIFSADNIKKGSKVDHDAYDVIPEFLKPEFKIFLKTGKVVKQLDLFAAA